MNLAQKAGTITWPQTNFIFIEKIGPFQETARAAWQELYALIPQIAANHRITGKMAMYKIDPNGMTYRAGVSVASFTRELPAGLSTVVFKGGTYTCFVLTGSYAHLPAACGEAFGRFAKQKISPREDFCIEHYVNDPQAVPEEELVTEILIPTI